VPEQAHASSNGGRSWRAIATHVPGSRIALPSALFAASRHARIRLRVSDGFDSTQALSARFVVVSRAPDVSITAPARGQRVRGDAVLNLAGSAYDDRGRPIPSRRLTWLDGKRRLGRGPEAILTRPAPGRHAIRLVARDASGRTGSASVRIAVAAALPRVLELKAPARLRRTARRFTFRLASTIAATLTAAGRRFRVGRSATAVTVRVKPGRSLLRVPLRLTAHGKRARSVLVVPRR
jgi:hypothetical protein